MKVGTILISSKFFAKIPFIKPRTENKSEVRKTDKIVIKRLSIVIWTKIMLTKITTYPTINPRTIPPEIKPSNTAQLGIGEIIISSKAFWNLAP